MTQCQSQLSQMSDVIIKIQNCLLKSLKSAQTLLDPDTVQNIRVKVQQISNSDTMVESIQYYIFALINNIESLRQSIHINVQKQDYQNLQGAVQKAEAEIRKHIRLQQQLKIYMDGLEQKIQQLEKQLKVQSKKYHQLYQSTRAMDLEAKQLKKRIKSYQIKIKPSQQKQVRMLSHKTSKILSQPSIYQSQTNAYKIYNEKGRITRAKNFIDRSSDQKYLNISHNVDQSQKKRLDSDIDVSLAHSPSRKKQEAQKTDIKQMTRTIQLKQNYKKHSRKLLKYSTDQRINNINKRDARSNSVCH